MTVRATRRRREPPQSVRLNWPVAIALVVDVALLAAGLALALAAVGVSS